jgi:hypothetical protein
MSTARSKDQRRADALSIGGQTARLRVGDEARSLLVGGDWQDGHWFLVDAGTHPCWLTPDGRRVNADHVQGVHFLILTRWSGFAGADQVAYCETCERNVPVVGDPLRYADHDKRGRTIEAGEGRA